MKKEYCIALAGNPNSGKTTIFNNLTGARQHVGNYPGVTVERKEGYLKHEGTTIKVVDLPGSYALSPYSPDEVVTREVIIRERPDVIVNIVDISNLQRNLNLTLQLKELEVPIILVLNMYDLTEKIGLRVDMNLLSQLLGIPVISSTGSKNVGTDKIIATVLQVLSSKEYSNKTIRYRAEIEEAISSLEETLLSAKEYQEIENIDVIKLSPRRWVAIKLIEGDNELYKEIKNLSQADKLFAAIESSRANIKTVTGDDAEVVIAEDRYASINGIFHEACQKEIISKVTATEKIDRVLLNRIIGLPLFLAMMWLLFQLTFTIGNYPMGWIETGFTTLADYLNETMSEGMLRSLLVDGIIGGVGGVVVFLPNILLLFLGIAFLEASGYMSRAAFLMDRIMHKAGLHGKSFIPMLIGFGCSIPAIMATRTLENPRDRLVTILITPLMSCGARLPVYILLIAAFFPEHAGTVLFSIYLIGIIMAIIMARVFRTWLLPGEAEPFVMELPIYRLPSFKSILIHMWERSWLYLKKAGTLILAVSIIMWALFTYPETESITPEPVSAEVQLENSYAGTVGKIIEPVLKPLGFDWKTGIALVAGFGAKEVVVSTLGTLYSLSEEDLEDDSDNPETGANAFARRAQASSGYTPLTAYVLMIFTLLYVPCMASIAVIKRETNSWKWPGFTIIYTIALAWIVSFIVFQLGQLLGIGV